MSLGQFLCSSLHQRRDLCRRIHLGAEMGPIVTEAAPQRITGYIDKGVTEGAERLVDGRHFDASDTGIDCAEFVIPTAR